MNKLPLELAVRLQAINSVAVPMVITDSFPTIIWANDAWSNMTGYSLEEAIGKCPSDIVKSGKMKEAFYQNMWSILLSEKVWKGRIVNRRKNGQFYTEEMSITPFKSKSDGQIYYIGIKEDVSLEEILIQSSYIDKQSVLFDMGSSIIVVLNSHGEIQEINQMGAQLVGYQAHELRGKNWFDNIILNDEAETMKGVFQNIIDGKLNNLENYINKIRTKTGEIKHISWYNHLICEETGNISGIISSGWNITELVEKTEIIERQNALLNLESQISKLSNKNLDKDQFLSEIVDELFKSNIVISAWIVIENKINATFSSAQKGLIDVEFNERVKKIIQHPSALLCLNGKGEDQVHQCKQNNENYTKDCPYFEIEQKGNVAIGWFNLNSQFKCIISILFSYKNVFLEAEEIIINNIFNTIKGYIANKIADEQLVDAEIKLKTSVDKQKLIFHNNLSANYITTPGGKIIDCNSSFLKLLKLKTREEALSSDPNRFYPEGSIRKNFIEKLIIDRVIENSEWDYLTTEGKTLSVLENIVGQFDENGNLIEIHGFLVDITELKNKEIRLKEALEKAKESEHLKAAFLSNISHEIRTPMNHIMGFAHVLRDNDLNKEIRDSLLNTIESSGDKLVKMISDIIDLSKLDAGQLKLNPVYFDFNELVFALLNEKQNKLIEDNSPIIIACDQDLTIQKEIFADKNRLLQVMESFVSNAIKFSNQGKIIIDFRFHEQQLEFSVTDQGFGIKMQDFNKIFKRFVKGSHPDIQNLGGAGLGLSLANEIIKLMGGEIKVKSQFGQGSTFSFTLNNIKTREQINIDKRLMNEEKKMENLKILIAEDDESNFQLLKILLKPFQAEILRAWNGVEAIEMVHQHHDLSLILMDLKMPEMDGFTATREIKLIKPKLPIIAQTAYALVGDNEKALASGCDFYISKPIDHRKLKEVVEKAIMRNY